MSIYKIAEQYQFNLDKAITEFLNKNGISGTLQEMIYKMTTENYTIIRSIESRDYITDCQTIKISDLKLFKDGVEIDKMQIKTSITINIPSEVKDGKV